MKTKQMTISEGWYLLLNCSAKCENGPYLSEGVGRGATTPSTNLRVVIGLRSDSKGKLGIYVQEIQVEGITGKDAGHLYPPTGLGPRGAGQRQRTGLNVAE